MKVKPKANIIYDGQYFVAGKTYEIAQEIIDVIGASYFVILEEKEAKMVSDKMIQKPPESKQVKKRSKDDESFGDR